MAAHLHRRESPPITGPKERRVLRLLILLIFAALVFRMMATSGDRATSALEANDSMANAMLLPMDVQQQRASIRGAELVSDDAFMLVVFSSEDASADPETVRWLCKEALEHGVRIDAAAVRDPTHANRYRFQANCPAP